MASNCSTTDIVTGNYGSAPNQQSRTRTCRAFHKPATEVLWTNFDALDPLIKLMPRRMWVRPHYPLVVGTFVQTKHWLVFQEYASRKVHPASVHRDHITRFWFPAPLASYGRSLRY
ncbi:hypothetical protein J3A83DRAFT_4249488 [Scleroderma citrinum]